MQTNPTTETALNSATLSTPTIRQEWQVFFLRFWQAIQAVLPIFLFTRLLLLVLTLIVKSGGQNIQEALYHWYHWDAPRYLSIADKGYLTASTTGYFPLYPAVVHALTAISHRNSLLIGLLISHLAFFISLLVLFRLTEHEFDQITARRAVFCLAIFPTAFLSGAATADTCLLLFFLLAYYTLRRSYWWQAGLFGALAALTHPAGILIFPVFLTEFFRQRGKMLILALRERRLAELLQAGSGLLASLLIILGLGIYTQALQRQFANPWIYLTRSGGMLSQFYWPWQTVQAIFQAFSGVSPFSTLALLAFIQLVTLIILLTTFILSLVGPLRFKIESGRQRLWSLQLFMLLLVIYCLILPAVPSGFPKISNPMPVVLPVSMVSFGSPLVIAQFRRSERRYFWLLVIYAVLAILLYAFLTLQLLTNRWTI